MKGTGTENRRMSVAEIRTGALAALTAACSLLAAGPALGAAGPGVKVASGADKAELVERLPISTEAGASEQVVMSLPVGRAGGLRPGDELGISFELQVTVDCDEPSRRCIGDPYNYNPAISTRAVLATDPGEIEGPGVVPLAAPRSEICRQRAPFREHHCVLVRETEPAVVAADTPCLESQCFVNLITDASNRNATPNDFVAVGGLRPNGSIPQDRGRLNLVRFRNGRPPAVELSTDDRLSPRLLLDQGRNVIYSQRLDDLALGEQFVVRAVAPIDITRLPYNVVLSSQLIVTDGRGDLTPGRSRQFVTSRGELDEGNSFNCTQNKRLCLIRKLGVMRVREHPLTASGKPMPLFLSLVVRAGPKADDAPEGDRARVRTGGSLEISRYAASALRRQRAPAGATPPPGR